MEIESQENKDVMVKLWKDRSLKLLIFIIISIFFSTIIVAILFFTKENYEPEMPVTEPPKIFMYPMSDPEFLTVGDIRLSYEFVSEGRHLVAVDDGEDSYIMPLFESREEAVAFMISYFDFLRTK